jgi:hypothetical protein
VLCQEFDTSRVARTNDAGGARSYRQGMASAAKEEPQMKHRKRLKLRLLALGLAAAAIAAPAAQAMPDGIDGVQARSLQQSRNVVVSPDDRAIGIRAEHVSQSQSPVIVSPDDRALNRASSQPEASPSTVSDSGGFELGTVALSGLVLLLAAGGLTALAIHQNQKGRLANA